jgi:Leucine-rich repeat (LRR) protein
LRLGSPFLYAYPIIYSFLGDSEGDVMKKLMLLMLIWVGVLVVKPCFGMEDDRSKLNWRNRGLVDWSERGDMASLWHKLSDKYAHTVEGKSLIKHIDLSHNNLTGDSLTTICMLFPNLETLDVSHNKISSLYGLRLCKNIQEVDLSNNRIDEFSEFRFPIKNAANLQRLIITGNPVVEDETVPYNPGERFSYENNLHNGAKEIVVKKLIDNQQKMNNKVEAGSGEYDSFGSSEDGTEEDEEEGDDEDSMEAVEQSVKEQKKSATSNTIDLHEQKFKITSSDEEEFKIGLSSILQSETLNNLYKSGNYEYNLPLEAAVDGDTLKCIIAYLKEPDNKQEGIIQNWYQNLSLEEFIKIAHAATYFDIKSTIGSRDLTLFLCDLILKQLTIQDYKDKKDLLGSLTPVFRKVLAIQLSSKITIFNDIAQKAFADFLQREKLVDIVKQKEKCGSTTMTDFNFDYAKAKLHDFFNALSASECIVVMSNMVYAPLMDDLFGLIATWMADKLTVVDYLAHKDALAQIIPYLKQLVINKLSEQVAIEQDDNNNWNTFLDSESLLSIMTLKNLHNVKEFMGANDAFVSNLKYLFYKSIGKSSIWQDLYYEQYYPYKTWVNRALGIGAVGAASYLWYKNRMAPKKE